LLDACTSYGTQLLWPFSDYRVSWNIISVVDPLYTLPLLVAVALAFKSRRARWARRAVVFSLVYLGFGLLQRERASDVQERLAAERGHHAFTRPTVKPSIGNLVLWRSIYEYEGSYHVDAIRVGVSRDPIIYPGQAIAVFDYVAAIAALPESSVLAHDIRRFAHFSEGYLAALPEREYLTDLRYSPIPNSIEPLWGIDLSGRRPGDHVAYVEADMRGGEYGAILWKMLRGEPVPSQ
jgi:inner membrane protein